MSVDNGGARILHGLLPVSVSLDETEHFEIVPIKRREITYFYICAKPHYDKAINCGPNTWQKAIELMTKFEHLWPCHFLAKEWHQ
jgi:hypothetical protein